MRNKKTNRYIKPAKDKCGYLNVNLSNNNKGKTITIHRLVAQAFIPNTENKKQVNHIDGNKENNYVNNLEWVSPSENLKHAYNIGIKTIGINQRKFCSELGKALSKKVNQYDLQGNFIRTWECMRDVERELNISCERISLCCQGKAKTTGGYIWKYVKEE